MKFWAFSLFLLFPLSVEAAPVKGDKIFDAGGRGNAFFNARLRQELRADGWKFVKTRAQADAILTSRGDWTKNGFAGTLILRNKDGKIVWRRQIERKNGENTMVFQKLSRELRAARR